MHQLAAPNKYITKMIYQQNHAYYTQISPNGELGNNIGIYPLNMDDDDMVLQTIQTLNGPEEQVEEPWSHH